MTEDVEKKNLIASLKARRKRLLEECRHIRELRVDLFWQNRRKLNELLEIREQLKQLRT